jgi:hypothetical protein
MHHSGPRTRKHKGPPQNTHRQLILHKTIRNYTIDPTCYKHYLHKEPLHLADQLLRARDTKQLQTHVGKVKSHTDIEYNESADSAARLLVDGEVPPDITFDEADPPHRGPPHMATNKAQNTRQTGHHSYNNQPKDRHYTSNQRHNTHHNQRRI